ncbi:MAG: hypothetical protein HY862_17550 [Chloroflexi bacterium]|nr:hypothetical protein [Chloroflexota bacterium]
MTDSESSKKWQNTLYEHTRKRPGMFIGGTDARALHRLLFEALDHAIDEALIGRCTHIWLTLLPENQVLIQDDSLGIPMIPTRWENLTLMEAVLERTGVFRDQQGEYEDTGSSFGAGLRVVNALSSEMRAENAHQGQVWAKSYHAGLADGPLQPIDGIPEIEHGLKLIFTPDFTIFESNPFDFEHIVQRCREIAYQIAGLKFTVRDERTTQPREEICFAPEGLKTWVQELKAKGKPAHDIVHIIQEIPRQSSYGNEYSIHVEFAFQFTNKPKPYIRSFVNLMETSNGGTHLDAFKAGILGYLNECLALETQHNGISLEALWGIISKYLIAIVCIRHPYPAFYGSTPLQLKNYDVYGPITDLVYAAFASQHRKMDPRKFSMYFHSIIKSDSTD